MLKSDLIKYIQHTPNNFNVSVFNSLFNTYTQSIKDFYEKSNFRKVEDYLYALEYDSIDYKAGEKYVERFVPQGACSSIRKDNLFGRNYDWYYDNTATFVIKTTDGAPHKSLGVNGSINALTESIANTLSWNEAYLYLPTILLDGINDAGVVCNMNVAPTGDHGITLQNSKNKKSLCGVQLCRYILDNAESADNAIELIDGLNIWMPRGKTLSSELHYMIADINKTYIVEFINNKLKVIGEFVNNKPIMTNFYLDGFDGTKQSLTPFGAGFERWSILDSGLDSVSNENDMMALMKTVKFTNGYNANPPWYSDFVGVYSDRILTNESPEEDFLPIIAKAKEMYEARTRDKHDTWQTIHSSVYDIENKTLLISAQENNTTYKFSLED